MKTSADGKKKWALLLTKPAGPIPTAAELNGGMDFSCNVLESDIAWSATASDRFNEKVSCQKGNAQALGASNYDLALTLVREWLASGTGADVSGADAAYQAVKVKDTTVWIYMRETDKDSTEPWADGDEIFLGGEVKTDTPTRPNNEGNIKRRVEFLAQNMISEVPVAAAGP
ncbi:hypothetical protein [Glutamicibacter sp. PS]|uniref:phage tail tube protein n=1 Tax=Glutamicibacter sp. PS TaxID=3075634 RepID=UPI00284C3286|nr:hypothetical protein [Glutamicibacter sp. PS]MDR4533211.1 hypothetical protein [Glutamicibacter sp. PS]